MFERFTEEARQAIVYAQEEARELCHGYIGSEHVLLGLMRVDGCAAASVLQHLGITIARARTQVVGAVGRGESGPGAAQIPFTPRAKKALELALREALALGHNYIGTEHLLLGLVRDGDAVGTRVLLELGAGAETIRALVLEEIEKRPPPAEAHQTRLGRPAPIPAIEIGYDPAVLRTVRLAGALALRDDRDTIQPRDLLRALVGDASIAALLAELGVDQRTLLDAIERLDDDGPEAQVGSGS